MDHYAPVPDLTQPWRTLTLIATTIATVELLALIGLGIALLGKGWFQHARAAATQQQRVTHHPAATSPPAAEPAFRARTTPAPARPLLTRAQTRVLVLNGNGQNGAAGAEASVLHTHGYSIAAVGNAGRSNYATSIVMYRPGYSREARRLARDVGIRVVTALDGLLPRQLGSARLALIVGK